MYCSWRCSACQMMWAAVRGMVPRHQCSMKTLGRLRAPDTKWDVRRYDLNPEPKTHRQLSDAVQVP